MSAFAGGKSGSKSTLPVQLQYRDYLCPSPCNAVRQPIYGPSLWLHRIRWWLDDL